MEREDIERLKKGWLQYLKEVVEVLAKIFMIII